MANSAKQRSSGHKHKKQFGQNFLNNGRVIDQIVASIRPRKDDHMVEIGPGEAALTTPLIEIVARLEIIEIDNDLITPLKIKFATKPAFKLHHTDALAFDYARLLDDSPGKLLRIIGNLPYNISSPLLFHLLQYGHQIKDMHFMLQKEVVDRLTAKPGIKAYGRLSVMIQYACETEYLFTVGPENFTPPPKVDSAIVRLVPYTNKPFIADNESCFADLVKQAFSQKRKTLRNNLKGWLNSEQIISCEIDPSTRAETIPVAKFVELANLYNKLQNQSNKAFSHHRNS